MKIVLTPFPVASARKIAGGWLLVGSLLFVFAAGAGIAHYGFGVPIHEAHTVRDATSSEIVTTFGALLLGGALFALLGAVWLWRLRRAT